MWRCSIETLKSFNREKTVLYKCNRFKNKELAFSLLLRYKYWLFYKACNFSLLPLKSIHYDLIMNQYELFIISYMVVGGVPDLIGSSIALYSSLFFDAITKQRQKQLGKKKGFVSAKSLQFIKEAKSGTQDRNP